MCSGAAEPAPRTERTDRSTESPPAGGLSRPSRTGIRYARRREASGVLTAAAVRAGDEPSVVSQVIVAAATDTHPRLRYPAGTLARRVSKLRRYVPPAIFDKQIRKTSQLAA